MSDPVTYRREGRVGIIGIDSPPVNALGHGVRVGILSALDAAEADSEAQAIVLVCAGRTFIAGADISEFDKPPQAPFHDEVINRLENAAKPVIAAIHGTALGGGLETALGCHYRVAVADARFGLPEVNLGIIPGAGGTQRLPRLIGAAPALKIIVSGVPVGADEALSLGLVDHIVPDTLEAGALAFAEELLTEGKGPRKIADMNEHTGALGEEVLEQTRQLAQKVKPGQDAPLRAIEAVAYGLSHRFDEGLAKEQELFEACLHATQSQSLRHLFFAERMANKIPDVPPSTPVREIRSAAVIGAGTMGGGIAMALANAGIPVYLLDSDQEGLDRGFGIVKKNYESSARKGKLSPQELEKRLGLITPTLSYDDLKEVDLVIEAVFEEMDLKKAVFERLDEVCKAEAILATNTSTLDVDAIAATTKRPENVIGLHFFSPANIMRLLEIVRGAKTAADVIATSFALAKRIKKIGVLVGVCDGFVGNRMVHPYVREALFLLEEGALPQQVDRAMQRFGMAMGPFAMSDLAGLDVSWRIRKRQAATRPADERYAEIADLVCEAGRYGQKTGAGWYRYEQGSRLPQPDPSIESMILAESERKGIERREIGDEEIVERCVYALINEGARILEEGLALRSSDIDVIYIYGYGFPAYRGGPMFYGDTVGLKKVYEQVEAFHKRHGALWAPAPLLKSLAEERGRFSTWKKD